MKLTKLLIFFVTIFLLTNVCFAASRVFYENFDDGNANEFDRHTALVVSATPHSGGYCGRANWNSQQSTSDFMVSSWDYDQETFIRFWIRIDPNCEAEEGAKFLRLGFDGGNSDTYHEVNTGTGGVHRPWYVNGKCVLDVYGGSLGLSSWTKYEIYIKHDTNDSNGELKVWINDQLVAKYNGWHGDTFDGTEKWYPLHLPSNWVHRGPEPNYVYFDDVEIYSDIGSGAIGSMADGTITIAEGEDSTPPDTYGHNPGKSATDVPVNTNVVVHVRDGGDGVDQSTIVLRVNGETVSPQISGNFSDYTLTYDPSNDFPYGTTINVAVDAQDLAGNIMPTDSYSFTTVAEPDTVPPIIQITNPTSESSYETISSSISISGTASDNVQVTSVRWNNSRGGSGNATGTTNWTINGITLAEGENVITVTAHDGSGNSQSDILTVNYTIPPGTYTMTFGNTQDADFPGTIQDTYININSTNYVSSQYLRTYTWPTDKPSNAIVMKFDLSAIPSDAQIQSAIVYLYMNDMEAGGGDELYDVSAHKIINHNPNLEQCTGYTYDGTNGWTPNNSCYNNVPLAQADIAPAEDTKSLDKTYGYKTWTVTNMVKDWIANPSTNYGLLLNSDSSASSNSNRYFASSEANDPSQRPKLVITYTVGEDTTPPGDVTSFTATSGPGQITLTWTNPTDTDFAGVMLRYRTDGTYPQNKDDGSPIPNGNGGKIAGSPGQNMSYVHTNLDPETHYYYSAFSYDTSNNYSQTAHADAQPLSSNNAPVIENFTANPTTLNNPGETTTFNVSATDPDGDSLTYTINFGDGTANGSGSQVVHTYEAKGTYTAEVSVDDGHGHSVPETLQMTVNDIPPAKPTNISAN